LQVILSNSPPEGEELHNFATIVQPNTTLRNSVVRTGLTVAICIASYREDAVYTPSIAGVLVGRSPEMNNFEFLLGTRTVLGRDKCANIRLLDTTISKFHTEVEINENGNVTVRDLGSRNGTKYDEQTQILKMAKPEFEIKVLPYSQLQDAHNEAQEDKSGWFNRRSANCSGAAQTEHFSYPNKPEDDRTRECQF
jgi:hypothetical protein